MRLVAVVALAAVREHLVVGLLEQQTVKLALTRTVFHLLAQAAHLPTAIQPAEQQTLAACVVVAAVLVEDTHHLLSEIRLAVPVVQVGRCLSASPQLCRHILAEAEQQDQTGRLETDQIPQTTILAEMVVAAVLLRQPALP